MHWVEKLGKWQAQIQINGKIIYLGIFDIEITAFRAYYDAVLKTGEEVIGFSYPLETKEEREHCSFGKYRKAVIGINVLNPDDIIKFNGMSEASKIGGFLASEISSCCHGRTKTHYGYQWKLANIKEELYV